MKTTRVYDLPTRLFHWIFAAVFIGAFVIAKTFDDDSAYYAYHMLLGLVLAFIVGLRVLWGIFGSRYARFSSFALHPTHLVQYFKNLFTGKNERMLGHNPASSWAALLMMGLAIGLAVTGYLMTSGGYDKEIFEDIHELLANAFIIVVIAHIAGIAFHSIQHKDAIGFSMVHGRKKGIENGEGIAHSHRGVAVVFALFVAGFIFHLSANFDSNTQALNLFGTSLQLGESEGDEHSGAGEEGHDDDEEEDDD